MPFCLKVNFHDKIFVNIPKFHVPSTLTSSSTSHAFREKNFVNKIFVIQEHESHEIFRPQKLQYSYVAHDKK